MTTKHQVGEKVRITIEGVITEVDGTSGEHIEITYAFSDRLKAALGVLPEASGVTIESLEDGAAPVAEKPLVLGDVWQDRDGDTWRVINNGELLLTSDGASDVRRTWTHVTNRYSPLTLVKHMDSPPARRSVPATPTLKLGDVWKDADGDEWSVGPGDDGTLCLKHGGMQRTWTSVNAPYGPLALVSSAS